MNIRPKVGLSKSGYPTIDSSISYLQPRIQLRDGSDSNQTPPSLDLLIHPILTGNDEKTIIEELSTIRESGFDGHIVLAHLRSDIPKISEIRLSNYGDVYSSPVGIIGVIDGGNRFVYNGGSLTRKISKILGIEYDYRCPIDYLNGSIIPSMGNESLRPYTNPRYRLECWRNEDE